MRTPETSYQVVIAGGGLAGFCAAIAAARHGARTCLIQDRPVLGGNASSEIGVTIHGCAAGHSHTREGGIVGEAVNAQNRLNHVQHFENGSANSVMDMVLYDMAVREPNLTLHLNTSLRDVQLADGAWGLDALGRWPTRRVAIATARPAIRACGYRQCARWSPTPRPNS
jgi:2-polyprenyl-6-methoxyphenol hydroxylase-like FAD-dependent oxidoreductase